MDLEGGELALPCPVAGRPIGTADADSPVGVPVPASGRGFRRRRLQTAARTGRDDARCSSVEPARLAACSDALRWLLAAALLPSSALAGGMPAAAAGEPSPGRRRSRRSSSRADAPSPRRPALLPRPRARPAARRGASSTRTSRSSGTATWSTTSRSRPSRTADGVALMVTRRRAPGPALDRLPGPEAISSDRHPATRSTTQRIRAARGRAALDWASSRGSRR